MPFAERTEVPADQTRREIEALLMKRGADRFAQYVAADPPVGIIAFELSHRRYSFHLPLPAVTDFQESTGGRKRGATAAKAAYEQAIRARWRALLLVIRAKFEAVDRGVITLEDEFLAHAVMPSGKTVGDYVRQSLPALYRGESVPLLPPPAATTSAG